MIDQDVHKITNDKRVLSIDFDGVIHKYSKRWYDGTCYDEPVEGAIDALKKFIDNGFRIKILSARAQNKRQIENIKEWFLKYGLLKKYLKKIEISNIKTHAIAYIDDRSIRFTNCNDI